LKSDKCHTLRWKDGSRWLFGVTISSAFGQVVLAVTQQIDRTGNTVTNTWSGATITAIAGPDGRALTLEYDGAGRITKVTDPIGRAVQYAYAGAGNLATVTDPEGGTTRYEYDSNNRMTRITDAKGITFLQNFYGPSGRVLRQIQADDSEYRFRYQLTGATSSGAGCPVRLSDRAFLLDTPSASTVTELISRRWLRLFHHSFTISAVVRLFLTQNLLTASPVDRPPPDEPSAAQLLPLASFR